MSLCYVKKIALTIAIATGSSSCALAADLPIKAPALITDNSPFFIVNDNRLTYAYQFNATSPGASSSTAKQVYAFNHFDVWAYGTNFISAQLRKSDHSDPASPCIPVNVGIPNTLNCAGASEFYGFFRSTLGWNELFDTKQFTIGPLRNVSFELGADGETENQWLAPAKKNVVAGLQFAFDLPYKGYFNIAPMYYQEWNHNGFLQSGTGFTGPFPGISDGNTRYRGTWAVEMNYYMDLDFLPENLRYFAISGNANFYGPKGTGAPRGMVDPVNNTKTEILSEPIRLTLDVGKLAWGPKYSHYVETWVAYRYWHNKFGLDDGNPANIACFTSNGANNHSCTEKTLYSGVTVKF